MPKKPTSSQRPAPQPVPGYATVRRTGRDGEVKLAMAFQPQDAARLSDLLVNALLRNRKPR